MSTTHTTTPSIWSRLRTDFDYLNRRPRNRRTVSSWARADPRFDRCRTPEDVVHAARGYDATSVAVASAVLERADTGDLAGRILFEAAVPRLIHLSRRAVSYASQSFCPHLVDQDNPGRWAPPDVVAADTVNFGFEWITRHAGDTVAHPIRSMRDWVRDQLRIAASQAIREKAARRALLQQRREPVAPVALSPAEQLAELLRAARRDGVLTAADAHLVFATRVGRMSLDDAAVQRGMVYDSVRRRRRRAELQLADHVCALEPAR